MAKKSEVKTEEVKTEEITDDKVSEDIESFTDVFKDSEDEPEGEPKDDKGELEDKVTDPVEPEPEKTESKVEEKSSVETPSTESIGLQAALVAERHKRQKAEEELRGLQKPEEVPDPIEDPKGYADFISAKSSKGLLDTKIELSRDLMIDAKDDYLEQEKVFMGLIGDVDDDGKLTITDESLFKKFQASKNPARFAYNHAIEHLEFTAYRDPKYKDNLRAEIKAEILAELKGEKPEGVSAVEVPNLTSATATKSNSDPVEKVEELGDMFPEEKGI